MSGGERGPWRGRVDAEEGAAGERWHQRVAFSPPSEGGVALLGLASDLGVIRNKGRPGWVKLTTRRAWCSCQYCLLNLLCGQRYFCKIDTLLTNQRKLFWTNGGCLPPSNSSQGSMFLSDDSLVRQGPSLPFLNFLILHDPGCVGWVLLE